MNFAQLRALAVSVGFADNSDADTAAAIAMAESGGNPLAQGDPPGPATVTPNGTSTSFGLWQIHTPAWPQFNAQSLLDPTYNANAALVVAKSPRGFKNWSTFNPNAQGVRLYLQYMPVWARAWPAIQVAGLILASSVIVSEVIRHGGVENTWRATQRTIRRYV